MGGMSKWVETLVYNLLDSILNLEELSLVEINRLRKGRDERLTTEAGIPDIAIVSEKFRYGNTIKRENSSGKNNWQLARGIKGRRMGRWVKYLT